mmetsp:Transcript_77644/g.240581  ORF Transcript_77644/g.240581 Transcript_77644/m.240581 type:complete len:256 (+) Transcript_77644:281-1048(+)
MPKQPTKPTTNPSQDQRQHWGLVAPSHDMCCLHPGAQLAHACLAPEKQRSSKPALRGRHHQCEYQRRPGLGMLAAAAHGLHGRPRGVSSDNGAIGQLRGGATHDRPEDEREDACGLAHGSAHRKDNLLGVLEVECDRAVLLLRRQHQGVGRVVGAGALHRGRERARVPPCDLELRLVGDVVVLVAAQLHKLDAAIAADAGIQVEECDRKLRERKRLLGRGVETAQPQGDVGAGVDVHRREGPLQTVVLRPLRLVA